MTDYYRAYDLRYRAVHALGLQWASDVPTDIVCKVAEELSLSPAASILELGCGEGRDAAALLRRGYDVTATDISPEAVAWCKSRYPEYAGHFTVLDCVRDDFPGKYDFIYAVAVLHMLTEDPDRAAFWRFIREHLADAGAALVLTMGDGTVSRTTDPAHAFDSVQRVHEATGKTVTVAATTCRIVDFAALRREIASAGLEFLRESSTACPPDFDVMMYAIVGVK